MSVARIMCFLSGCQRFWKEYKPNGMILLSLYFRVFYRGFMVDSQQGAQRRAGYNHLVSKEQEWNNCFIKNISSNGGSYEQ